MKQRTVRSIIISAILLMFAGFTIYNFSVEPADYKLSIQKSIKSAEELIEKADVGNDTGQYSNYILKTFENEVQAARVIVEDENTTVEEEKKGWNTLKQNIKKFKKGANSNCLSYEQVNELKSQEKIYTADISLDNNTVANWHIDTRGIEVSKPINLDIRKDSPYDNNIKIILNDNNLDGMVLSFLHNGDLPCSSVIRMDYNNSAEEAFLYYFDGESNTITYVSNVTVKDKKAIFNINKGGVWIVSDDEIVQDDDKIKDNNEQKNKQSEKEQMKNKDENSSQKENTNSNKSSQPNKKNTDSGGSQATAPVNKTGNDNKDNQNDKEKVKYCTLEIRCNTILNNMDKLESGLGKYVPSNGVILTKTKIKLYEGENVFDVLKRTTRNKKIQMEFRNDPTYSGAYIEGINHLYEYSCGTDSGWMYKVNGWFPNYGCSAYKVKEGDQIVWCYTCDLGRDVGDQYYDTH